MIQIEISERMSANDCKAHVFEGAHRRAYEGWGNMSEPFLFDHKVKEMGEGWVSIFLPSPSNDVNDRVQLGSR